MMDIRYRKIDEIIPYEKNPRKNDDAVEAVAASIKEFGFRQPLVLNDQNVIIVGHTRYKAAKLLGMDTVPVVYASLTKEQEDAYRIIDNKSAELASWDWDKLAFEYAKVVEEGAVDMTPYSFDVDVEAVLKMLSEGSDQNTGKDLGDAGDDLDDVGDEHFRYECPQCGLKFN